MFIVYRLYTRSTSKVYYDVRCIFAGSLHDKRGTECLGTIVPALCHVIENLMTHSVGPWDDESLKLVVTDGYKAMINLLPLVFEELRSRHPRGCIRNQTLKIDLSIDRVEKLFLVYTPCMHSRYTLHIVYIYSTFTLHNVLLLCGLHVLFCRKGTVCGTGRTTLSIRPNGTRKRIQRKIWRLRTMLWTTGDVSERLWILIQWSMIVR